MPIESANRCPQCNCGDLRVTHTRHTTIKWAGVTKTRLKRRRVCRYCHYIFNTIELSEEEVIEAEVLINNLENGEL